MDKELQFVEVVEEVVVSTDDNADVIQLDSEPDFIARISVHDQVEMGSDGINYVPRVDRADATLSESLGSLAGRNATISLGGM